MITYPFETEHWRGRGFFGDLRWDASSQDGGEWEGSKLLLMVYVSVPAKEKILLARGDGGVVERVC